MIPLGAREIAAATGGRCDCDATVTGVAIDSRRVVPGDLFVALAGARTHGAAFLPAAAAAGAAAALVPAGADVPPGLCAVEVEDTRAALAEVAATVRRRARARVVGVTGSTGKTSTKDILAALLAPQARVVASRANENNEIGVPLTLCRTAPDTDVVVAEMAMRGLGEIAYLAAMARPDVAVITSVGPVHLELLGTVEAVAQAKAEILPALAADATAVVPHGEGLLAPYLRRTDATVVTFGDADGAEVRLVALRPAGDGGGEAELRLRGRTFRLPVNFTQHHNGLNLAAAVAACDALGADLDRLAEGSAAVTFSALRGELLPLPGGGVLVADCYNANPVSMVAALRHLREVAGDRRMVAVLGDMAELGPGAPAYHAEIGALARAAGVAELIGVGALSRAYGGRWFPTLDEALAGVPPLLRAGDAVLLKGSRSVGLEAMIERVAA
jgi:UDP-N-acetylmuramoyl-tripeptide--D-alanyl-D-alanine ligase